MVKLKLSDSEVTIEEPTNRWFWLRRLGWTLGHLLSGVGICYTLMWIARGSDSPKDPVTETPLPKHEASQESAVAVDPADLDPAEQLDRGDGLLRSGNYASALRIYNDLTSMWPDDGDQSLAFRKALCLELMGEFDRALSLYQSMLDDNDSREIVAAAKLGQARVWWRMDRKGPARSLLYSLIQVSSVQESLSGDVLHLLAHLSAAEAFEADTNLVMETTIVTPDPLSRREWPLKSFAVGQNDATTETSPVELQSLDRFSADLREIRLTLRKRATSLASLLQELADEAKLTLVPSPTARKVLQSRSVDIDVQDVDLATWMDSVLEPIGLIWQQELESVEIHISTEIPRERLRQLRKEQTQRLLRTALSLYPEHPLAASTSLVLGNTFFWNGQYEDSANTYHEIIRRANDNDILRTAWFNLSRSQILRGNNEAVRQAYFKCADLSRGHPIEAVAYLFLGRYFLDDGRSDSAIRQLIRAVSLARDIEIKQNAVEALACAYLIANNPQAANTMLIDHREILKHEPFSNKASFLSALSRFRAASQSHDRMRAGRSLANAVSHVDANRFFCFAAHSLVGEAYDEIGLPNQMQTVLVEALSDERHNDVRDQLMFRLGSHYVEDGKLDDGERIMMQLMAEDRDPWSRRAKLFLARIAIQRRQGDECLRLCHEMLQMDLSVQEKTQVLRLMGRVYEQKLDHYSAALCFAGLIPVATQAGSLHESLNAVSNEADR